MSTNEQASIKVRKTDRRIQRTKKLFSNALIGLILDGDYDTITIQQIADRADLSRATFYLHYDDKADLLRETLEDIYDGVAPQMGALSPGDFYWNGVPPSLPVFQHVADNLDLYRVMLKTQSGWKIVDDARKYLAQRCQHSLELTAQGKVPAEALETLSHYMAAALNGLIVWWLDHDQPYSAEEMAQQYHALIKPTLREILG